MPTTDRVFIHSRADFQNVLTSAQQETAGMLDRGDWWPLQSIALQLEAMRQWTADNRDPTPEEIESIQLGVVVVRELEPPATPELEHYNERLYELHGYFKEWLGDDDVGDEDDDDDDDDDDVTEEQPAQMSDGGQR